MKEGKKYRRMKIMAVVISACAFLTACGGETQETESKNVTQESITVSTSTIEQTDEQTQEATQEAENIVQTDAILENLKGRSEERR